MASPKVELTPPVVPANAAADLAAAQMPAPSTSAEVWTRAKSVEYLQRSESREILAGLLEFSITDLQLKPRVINKLQSVGVFDVRGVLNGNSKQFESISGFGEKSMDEVFEALVKLVQETERRISAISTPR